MEFYADLEYISFYVNNLYPSGIVIQIPTWVIVATIGLWYSVRLLRRDK
jgi:hypothetical protein